MTSSCLSSDVILSGRVAVDSKEEWTFEGSVRGIRPHAGMRFVLFPFDWFVSLLNSFLSGSLFISNVQHFYILK